MNAPATITTDVVIIGAGLSGLTAARRLTDRGFDVVVVEAKDRVGGRVHRKEMSPGKFLDIGGRFVGPGQDDLLRIAAEVGVETAPFFHDGRCVWNFDGQRWETDGDGPLRDPASREQYDAARAELERLAFTLPAGSPWAAPNAATLDRTSFATWLDANLDDTAARWALLFDLNSFFFVPAHRLSLLHVLSILASTGGWEILDQSDDRRIVGGSFEIAHRLAAALPGRVHTGQPVRSVDWSTQSVTVRTDDLTITARRCIVAMNPSDARTIRFEPVLPWARGLFHRQHQVQGGVMGILIYEHPFWRDAGYSGQVTTDLPAGTYVRDGSLPDGSLGALNSFMTPLSEGPWGAPIGVLDSPDARREAITSVVEMAFGPEARTAIDYVEQDWLNEPFTAGVQAALPPGLMTEVGAAAVEPIGAIHWSSTELGERWTGWMNGAIASAERVATEVASMLHS